MSCAPREARREGMRRRKASDLVREHLPGFLELAETLRDVFGASIDHIDVPGYQKGVDPIQAHIDAGGSVMTPSEIREHNKLVRQRGPKL